MYQIKEHDKKSTGDIAEKDMQISGLRNSLEETKVELEKTTKERSEYKKTMDRFRGVMENVKVPDHDEELK